MMAGRLRRKGGPSHLENETYSQNNCCSWDSFSLGRRGYEKQKCFWKSDGAFGRLRYGPRV